MSKCLHLNVHPNQVMKTKTMGDKFNSVQLKILNRKIVVILENSNSFLTLMGQENPIDMVLMMKLKGK